MEHCGPHGYYMKHKSALIGAAAVIIASLITALFSLFQNKGSEPNIQMQGGNQATNIVITGGINEFGLRTPEDRRIIDAQLKELASSNLDDSQKEARIIELTATINQLRSIQSMGGSSENESARILDDLSLRYGEDEFRRNAKEFITKNIKPNATCDKFEELAQGCSKCIDRSEPLYKGEIIRPNNTINTGSKALIYFRKENSVVADFHTIQQGSTWFRSDNLLGYDNEAIWNTAKDGSKYMYFEPNTSTTYLKAQNKKGIYLASANNLVDRNLPAYRLKFTTIFRDLIKKGEIGPMRVITSCTFYYAAWCGDGVVDLDNGEECDDGNSYNNDSCSTLCQSN